MLLLLLLLLLFLLLLLLLLLCTLLSSFHPSIIYLKITMPGKRIGGPASCTAARIYLRLLSLPFLREDWLRLEMSGELCLSKQIPWENIEKSIQSRNSADDFTALIWCCYFKCCAHFFHGGIQYQALKVQDPVHLPPPRRPLHPPLPPNQVLPTRGVLGHLGSFHNILQSPSYFYAFFYPSTSESTFLLDWFRENQQETMVFWCLPPKHSNSTNTLGNILQAVSIGHPLPGKYFEDRSVKESCALKVDQWLGPMRNIHIIVNYSRSQ